MKIAVIHNLYEPFSRGGAEVVVKSLVEALCARGHEVVLITSVPWKNRGVSVEKNLTIHRIASYNFFSYYDLSGCPGWLRPFWHLWNMVNVLGAWKVKQIVKGCDVVMTHNLMGLSFLIPWVIRSEKIRHLHVLHDVQLVIPSGTLMWGQEKTQLTSWSSRVATFWNKRVFGNPDIVISPSSFLLDFYTKRGFFLHSTKKVIPNPVLREITQRPMPNIFTVLFVGQVESHKGIHVLLEAFKTFSSFSLGVRLWVVGAGRLLPSLQQRYKQEKSISFLGRQEHSKVASFYQEASVVVVPSLCYENFPTVVFEAWSQGIPVIVSKLGGMAELDTVSFTPGNQEELVNVLSDLYVYKEKQEKWGKRGQEVVKTCTMERYVKELGF